MDIIEIYNPANASKLTEEQVQAMKDLTDEEITALAEAYPNQPTGNAYLRYYDKNEKESLQRYPLGTWKNLANLRKLGKKELLPFGFLKSVQPINANKNTKSLVPTTKRTVDLGADEKIEGLKGEPIAVNANADEFENKLPKVDPVVNQAVVDAQAELDKAIEEKAHHMTIKSLENKLAAAKEAADTL